MGNVTRPRLLEEDMKLLKAIAKHGFVDIQYVYFFLYKKNKKRTIDDRIVQLSKYAYVGIIKTFVPSEYTMFQKTGYQIITLAKEGLKLMRELGYDVIDNLHTLKTSAPYRMYHQVQVATTCDSLQLQFLSQQSKFEVCDIKNERESTLDGVSNQPDAIVLFKPKDNTKKLGIAIFIEIERSYSSEKTIERKLKSYESNIKTNRYQELFHIPLIKQRVVFVAQTSLQYEHILYKISQLNRGNIEVLVTTYQDICKQGLEDIYTNPYTLKKFKLLAESIEND